VELWITAARFDGDVVQSRMNIAPSQIATFREAPLSLPNRCCASVLRTFCARSTRATSSAAAKADPLRDRQRADLEFVLSLLRVRTNCGSSIAN
jgi:phage gp36-like protein